MARTSDRELRDRILDVALTLLRVQGEQGVTMRAVAEGAGTTTPTLYSRFPNKEALMLALALRERDRYIALQSAKKSIEEAARLYLEWAWKHPHEYRLIYGPLWPRVFALETGRPGLRWTEQQLAERFGGEPSEYQEIASGLWLLVHGAASLLTQSPTGPLAREVREQCLETCSRIIESGRRLRKGNQRGNRRKPLTH